MNNLASPAIEFQDGLAQRAAQGYLRVSWLDTLVDQLAKLHTQALPADDEQAYPEAFTDSLITTLDDITQQRGQYTPLASLARWMENTLAQQRPFLEARRREGWIRRGCGGLRLEQVRIQDNHPVILKPTGQVACPPLDVLHEVAALLVDLDYHGYRGLGMRCLNRYMTATGWLDGLHLLPLYGVYQSLQQALALTDTPQGETQRDDYLRLSLAWAVPTTPPILVITHGLTGSGKSEISSRLLELLGAVCYPAAALAPPDPAAYWRLLTLAEETLQAGFPVILDAPFLGRGERNAARALAQQLGVKFVILHCHTPAAVLSLRLHTHHPHDSEALALGLQHLMQQRARLEPLDTQEQHHVVGVDPHDLPSLLHLARRLQRRATLVL